MRLWPILLLALTTSALAQSPTQGPPDFGIDTSGTMRNLSVRDATLGSRVPLGILDTNTHSFVSATTPVESYGAKGDSNGTTGNGTDDTAAIEACVAGGRICTLRPGATYRLMSAIDIQTSGAGLIGTPGNPATLYCDPAGINNIDTSAGRYAQNGLCISLRKQAPTGEISNNILKDFKIDYGGQGGARCCSAIAAMWLRNPTIENLEIYNLPTAGIRFASWTGGRIVNNYIHDASNDTGAEYSGIEGDNDLQGGIDSTDVLISGNRVINMKVSEAGYQNTLVTPLQDGYQPNGIKITGGLRFTITDNIVESTGQNYDIYTDDSVISNNVAKNGLNFCISLKHSVHRNVVANNNLSYCGTGLLLIGDAAPLDASDNLVIGNRITNVQEGMWAAVGWSDPNLFQTSMDAPGTDGSCIGTLQNVTRNTITGNSCDPGPKGDYPWRIGYVGQTAPAGTANYWIGNYGKPGIGTYNLGRWYDYSRYESNTLTDDVQVKAFVPWIDVASTSSLKLPAGNLVNITGTATINDFTEGTAGQYYYIKFSGAVPLRCRPAGGDGTSGMLTCPAGVPATAAVDDMMMLFVDVPKGASSQVGGVYRVAWYRRADGAVPAVVNTNAADGTILLQRTNAGADVIPVYVRNASSTDGTSALMDFSSSGLSNSRSVQIGDIDKPTTPAHCFTVRTSVGAAPAERTFTCIGTVIGTPTGGTNGDMGAGTLNAQGVYINGASIVPAVASSPQPTLTFGGASTGIAQSASARSVIRDKQVFFQWQLTLTNKGSSVGAALLDGLPVAAIAGMFVPCTVRLNSMTAGVGDTALSCLLGGTTTVTLYKMVAGVATQLTDADFTNTSQVFISGTYITN